MIEYHIGKPGRIISAHAENRDSNTIIGSAQPDHLRACGEQRSMSKSLLLIKGSSPRMRRTAPNFRIEFMSGRIISAHAENRVDQDLRIFAASDHLRACGEQLVSRISLMLGSGSSPRMRRTVARILSPYAQGRIISAHAENRAIWFRDSSVVRDHLRACGEQARWSV